MADDAVGDEVPGSGRDVVQPHRHVERPDRLHAELRGVLNRESVNRPLARDRRVGAEKEAHPLGEPATEADVRDAVCEPRRLDHIIEAEPAEARLDPGDDLLIRARDAQGLFAATPLGIEDPGKEPLDPRKRRQARPLDERRNQLDLGPAFGADRADGPDKKNGSDKSSVASLNVDSC